VSTEPGAAHVAAFPDRFGEVQFELARLLFEHARLLNNELTEVYLLRSIQSYEVAASVFSKESNPRRWAAIHMYVGSIFMDHVSLDTTLNKKHDFLQALHCYQGASEVFADLEASEEEAVCDLAIKQIRQAAAEAAVTLED
jgi:hypothetical protein